MELEAAWCFNDSSTRAIITIRIPLVCSDVKAEMIFSLNVYLKKRRNNINKKSPVKFSYDEPINDHNLPLYSTYIVNQSHGFYIPDHLGWIHLPQVWIVYLWQGNWSTWLFLRHSYSFGKSWIPKDSFEFLFWIPGCWCQMKWPRNPEWRRALVLLVVAVGVLWCICIESSGTLWVKYQRTWPTDLKLEL